MNANGSIFHLGIQIMRLRRLLSFYPASSIAQRQERSPLSKHLLHVPLLPHTSNSMTDIISSYSGECSVLFVVDSVRSYVFSFSLRHCKTADFKTVKHILHASLATDTHHAELVVGWILLAEPVAGPSSELKLLGVFWIATSRCWSGHPLAAFPLACCVKSFAFSFVSILP